ncbi:MAG TPA: NMD3-related protein [Thermoplasmata archaeon]|nr:NMD3-related protein [Thermoplasmata archaeon]
MFCVECGKEGETYDGLCAECHLARRRFVSLPEILDVQVCGECFAVRLGKKWIDALSIEKAVQMGLEDSLEKEKSVSEVRLKTVLTQRDPRNYLANVTAQFKAGTFSASKDFVVNVRLKKDTCQRCGKKSGHYYEAIIQLRAPSTESGAGRIEQARGIVLSRVRKMGEQSRNIFISKEEKVQGGYDFYLSSSTTAKAIARDLTKAFGASSKTSNSMAGRKDGQDLSRMTYLVRIPDYEPGDIFSMDGGFYLLRSIEGNTLAFTDLETWQETKVAFGRLPEFETFDRKNHVKQADVISDLGNELQILDPETLRPVEVVKPKKFGNAKQSVSIVKTKRGILLVP